MKGQWLKEHITSIVALIITLSWVIVSVIVLTKEVRSDDKTTYLIIANTNGIIGFVCGYYFTATKNKQDSNNNSNNQKTDKT